MEKFSLSSNYFANVSAIANNSSAYRDLRFSIIINEKFKIDLPQIVAASISSTVTRLLETDQTSTELNIRLSSSKDINKTLEKLRQCIASQESVEISEDDVIIFSEFGKEIGNDEFSLPMKELLDKENATASVENVVDILITKQKFNIHDIRKEVSFIAKNFESMRLRNKFIQFSSNPDNLNIVEEILDSRDLKLLNEDSLASFILILCNSSDNNNAIMRLFEKVLFEYCSVEYCEKFLNLVNEVIEYPNIRSLVKCIGRRFVKPQIQLDQPFVENRHKKLFTEITNEDPLNGILRREHKKNNVLMESSTIFNNETSLNAYNLIDENDLNFFESKNYENSYFQASLKDDKTFVIKNYTVKGIKNIVGIQNWRLEGQKASNGEWIVIDRQTNLPINDGEAKSFNVSSREILKAVKLTQEGKSFGWNNYILYLGSFDIFGYLY